MKPSPDDERHMAAALDEARIAASAGDVPVGAIVARDGSILARASNRTVRDQDPTAHAELLAIRAAAESLGSWRLTWCTLYVTLEPCAMCAGAIVLARLPRVVFGAWDDKAGMAGSVGDLVRHPRLNHRAEVLAGVAAEESAALLQTFFESRRAQSEALVAAMKARSGPGPAVAVAPGSSLRGALALVIRDPGAEYPGLIVFAREELNERLYVATRHEYMMDTRAVPDASTRRVISVFGDDRLRLETGGTTKWKRLGAVIFKTQAERASRAILGALGHAKTIEVEGVGPVQLVSDGRQLFGPTTLPDLESP